MKKLFYFYYGYGSERTEKILFGKKYCKKPFRTKLYKELKDLVDGINISLKDDKSIYFGFTKNADLSL